MSVASGNSVRALWTSALLVLVVLFGLAAWTFSRQQAALQAQLRNSGFERSLAVQALFEQLRREALVSKASVLADNQAFVAYVIQALEQSSDADLLGDIGSVSDLLGERAKQLGFAVAAVIDDGGKALASSDALVPRGQNIGQNALLEQIVATGEAATTVIDGSSGPHLIALVPMQRGGLFDGFLLAGLRLDGPLLEDLAGAAAAEVSLLRHEQGGGTSVRYSNSALDLQQRLPALVEPEWTRLSAHDSIVRNGSETFQLSRLFDSNRLLLVYHLPAQRIDPALDQVSRPLLQAYLGLAVVLVLWLSWLHRRLRSLTR